MKTELPYDPNLKEAVKEIEEILKKRDAMACMLLVSKTHAEFFFRMNPSWSVAKVEETPSGKFAIRFRSKKEDFASKEMQQEMTESTAHGLTSMLQFGRMVESYMSEIIEKLSEHFGIAYKVWDRTPDDQK